MKKQDVQPEWAWEVRGEKNEKKSENDEICERKLQTRNPADDVCKHEIV